MVFDREKLLHLAARSSMIQFGEKDNLTCVSLYPTKRKKKENEKKTPTSSNDKLVALEDKTLLLRKGQNTTTAAGKERELTHLATERLLFEL